MSKLGRHKRKAVEDADVDMVPIMNMFLVLIPFLLLSASFFHIKAINTSVPVLSDAPSVTAKENKIKLIITLELNKDGIHLSAMSDELTDAQLAEFEFHLAKESQGQFPFDQMYGCLEKIKQKYPASDTVILIPDDDILYNTIVHAMDMARYTAEKSPLFPNVVLSGKVG